MNKKDTLSMDEIYKELMEILNSDVSDKSDHNNDKGQLNLTLGEQADWKRNVKPTIQDYAKNIGLPSALFDYVLETALKNSQEAITRLYLVYQSKGLEQFDAFYAAITAFMLGKVNIDISDETVDKVLNEYGVVKEQLEKEEIKSWQSYLCDVECIAFQSFLERGMPQDTLENILEWAIDNELPLDDVMDIFSHIGEIAVLYGHDYLVYELSKKILKLYERYDNA